MRAPVDTQLTPVPDSGAVRTEAQQRLSVLLVEDDRGDAILVEELIADAAADIDCIWAQSMADAERELMLTRPDCVLLDLNLPDANGIAALERIRGRRSQPADRGAHRVERRALRHVGGRFGRAGLPGQGPGRTRDAAARGAVRDRAKASGAHLRRVARQPTQGTRERPPRARPFAVPVVAGQPRGRDHREVCPES